jgi:beta-galactosidase
MKMGRFNSATYPLRITVDGKPAFDGATHRGLGYVTLSFTPVFGSKVRIALTGSGIYDDAFKLIEVTGTRLAETANGPSTAPSTAPKQLQGTLNIVEAEIYEPIKWSR